MRGSVFLENSRHAFLQTDGTMAWPNSLEGDLLRQAYGELMRRFIMFDLRGSQETFDVNHWVQVRLTPRGRELHRQNWEAIFQNIPNASPYSPPQEDGDGWSRWQLWELMKVFGPHINLGAQLPFQPEMRFEKLDIQPG